MGFERRLRALEGRLRLKMLERISPTQSCFSFQLKLGSWIAAGLLFTGANALAQGAAPGPMSPATPSDRPVEQPVVAAARAMTIGGKPNLSGTWILNKDESDDARKAIEDARGSSAQNGNGQPRWGGGGPGGGGGGGWGTHGGGNPGGNGGGNGNGGGGSRRQNGGGPNPLDNLSQLTIEQTESSIDVADDAGHELATYPAAKQSQPAPSSGSSNSSNGDTSNPPPPPTVEWKSSQLVVTEQQGRRGTTTRVFELSPDGKQLYVTTTIDNPRFKNPATIRFVYDPASSGG